MQITFEISSSTSTELAKPVKHKVEVVNNTF